MPQVRGGNLGLGVAVSLLRFPMPAGLQRYYGRGHLHFITFSCYRRLIVVYCLRRRVRLRSGRLLPLFYFRTPLAGFRAPTQTLLS